MTTSETTAVAEMPNITMLSVDALAAEWRVHPDTIRALIREGRLPAVRLGRRVRIRAIDAVEYVAGLDRIAIAP